MIAKMSANVKPLTLKRDRAFERRLNKLSEKMATEDRAEKEQTRAEAQADPLSALRRQQARHFAFSGLKIKRALS